MLADEVFVSVYGTLGEGLYSGYLSRDKKQNNVYIVSKSELSGSFPGIVTAVASLSDGTQRMIVSPRNEVMYEPDILFRLRKLKSLKVEKISCLYEKSCGAIIFYKTKQNTKILLVKNSNGRYWSFPKGHIEEGENEQQTAIREIKEETGLDVTLFNGFREISEYCPFGKIRKRVVFFLAQAFTDNVKIQEEEIDSYIWVDLQQARKMCSYDNDLRIIEKAETAIHLMRN